LTNIGLFIYLFIYFFSDDDWDYDICVHGHLGYLSWSDFFSFFFFFSCYCFDDLTLFLLLLLHSFPNALTTPSTSVLLKLVLPSFYVSGRECNFFTSNKTRSHVYLFIYLFIYYYYYFSPYRYFRHWQNFRILYSVYNDYETLVPPSARRWSPSNEVYLTGWMKWQIFAPIMLLQILNLFW
jgi:hypothetical protein